VLTYVYFDTRRDMPMPNRPATLAIDSLCTGLLEALREINGAERKSGERQRLLEVLRDRIVRIQRSEGAPVGELDQRS